MSINIKDLFQEMSARNASDIHLVAGLPPEFRVYGSLVRKDTEPLTSDVIKKAVLPILTESQLKEFEETKEIDFALSMPGLSRFRINIFRQRGSISLVARAIPFEIPTMEQLGLPPLLKEILEMPSGLVIVTGPVGSGKSTTLASMVEYLNMTKQYHVISIEDPIEFLFKHKKSTIEQREVREDTTSFKEALRRLFRQDPNVILVGEMRDLETIQTVLTLAETGHLILTTLHTRSAIHTIDRIIDVFPPYQQNQIKVQLSLVLSFVVVQQLLPRKDKEGRALAYETMYVTSPIRSLIREHSLSQIYSIIQTGKTQGMITMNQHLVKLCREGIVDRATAESFSPNLEELDSLLGTQFASH